VDRLAGMVDEREGEMCPRKGWLPCAPAPRPRGNQNAGTRGWHPARTPARTRAQDPGQDPGAGPGRRTPALPILAGAFIAIP
jgi:hypothetical protein